VVKERAIAVVKGAAIGFVLVFGACVAIAGAVTIIISLANLHSVRLDAGPVPLLSAWSGPDGYGFETGWGVGALINLGAVVGAVVAWRRERARA
jgi:hypothetical protein